MHNLRNILILFFLSACSSSYEENSHGFQIYEENGVSIAETSGGPKYEGNIFRFQKICELIEDPNNPESQLYRSKAYVADEAGYFYVADEGNGRIAVFNPDGIFHNSIGQQGYGPGEFQALRLLWIRNDSLAVFDYQLRRTSLFSTDGTFLRSYSNLTVSGTLLEIHPISNGSQFIKYRKTTREQDMDMHTYSAAVLSSIGDTLSIIDSPPEIFGRPFRSGRYAGLGITYYKPHSTILFKQDQGILFCASDKPVLRWYALDGSIKRIINLDFELETVTEKDRDNIHNYWQMRINNDEKRREFYVDYERYSTIPKVKSYWKEIIVDDAGYYWIKRHYDFQEYDRDRESISYRVLSPQGEYLGDTNWPFPQANVSNGFLSARQDDDSTSVTHYIIYKIHSTIEGFNYPN